MGPLVLLVFAGNLGLSMVMANSTANMTCTNGTQTAGNMTCPPHNMTAPPGNNTHPPQNTTKPPAPQPANTLPRVKLDFKLDQTFTPDLANKSSPKFKELANNITTQFDKVLSAKFGDAFNRSEVESFSAGSIRVALNLFFNNVTNASAVASAVSAAVASGNFSLPINASSIMATAVSTASATTVAATTAKAAANATAAATSAPSTAAATANEGTLGCQFSLDQTYTSDLANPSSAAHTALATTVITVMNGICSSAFGSNFSRSLLNSFTNGSVITAMTLVFKDKTSVPSVASATSAIAAGLTNSSLKFINGSLTVQTTTTNGCHPQFSGLSLLASSLAMMAAAQLLFRF